MRTLLAALTALMLFATPVVAAEDASITNRPDWKEAQKAAYKAGDYEKVIQLLKTAAEQGDAVGMINLAAWYGQSYYGVVPPNGTKMVCWYEKAVATGTHNSIKWEAEEDQCFHIPLLGERLKSQKAF